MLITQASLNTIWWTVYTIGKFNLEYFFKAASQYKHIKRYQPRIVGLLIVDICFECLSLTGDHTWNTGKNKHFSIDGSIVKALWIASF